MKAKSLALLGVAGICGLIAMVGVRQAMQKNKEPAVETAPVLVAIAELGIGDRLDETNSEFREVPLEAVSEDAITKREQYSDRVLTSTVMTGDWLTMKKLGEKGERGIVGNIPKGMRVVTVPVSATTSHSGMLLPENRVDVMLTYRARTEQGSVERTRTVLEYIQIFAVDKLVGGSGDIAEGNARNVSVLVTPEQGHLLLLCEKKGSIHLALRSNSDMEQQSEGTIAVTEEELENGLQGEFGKRFEDDEEPPGEEGEEVAESDPNAELESVLANAEPADVADVPVAQAVTGPSVDITPPEPPKNTWAITIYEGAGESRVQELIVPEPEVQAEEPVSPAGTPDNAPKKPLWKGLLGTYFKGA